MAEATEVMVLQLEVCFVFSLRGNIHISTYTFRFSRTSNFTDYLRNL